MLKVTLVVLMLVASIVALNGLSTEDVDPAPNDPEIKGEVTINGKKHAMHIKDNGKSGYIVYGGKHVPITISHGKASMKLHGQTVTFPVDIKITHSTTTYHYIMWYGHKVSIHFAAGGKSGYFMWKGKKVTFTVGKGGVLMIKFGGKTTTLHMGGSHGHSHGNTHAASGGCANSGRTYEINKKDCWGHCGKKGGACKWCGTDGFCCRKKFGGCNKRMLAVSLNTHHTCIRDTYGKGRTYEINKKDCWWHCGKKGGACKWCGKNGFCCRQKFGGCNKRMLAVSLNTHHTCVRDTCGETYQINKKDCWWHCGKKGGACKWCGKNGFCCRQKFGGCKKRMLAVSLNTHHTCIRDTYGSAVNDEENETEENEEDEPIEDETEEDETSENETEEDETTNDEAEENATAEEEMIE